MRLRTIIGNIAAFAFVSSTTFAQPPQNIPHPRLALIKQSQSTENNSHTAFEISAGVGEYPILEMPRTDFGDTRADGSTSATDLKINRGALLDLDLTRIIPTNLARYALNIGMQRLATVPGGGLPTPSSYLRLHADTSASFDLGPAFWNIVATPAVEARRSMYRNVESGHYVDAVLLKQAIEKSFSKKSTIELAGAYAPASRFGLLQDSKVGKSGALADATSQMYEISAKYKWTPETNTSFVLAASQESARVKLESSDGYKYYGLPVAPFTKREPTRLYDLTTRQLTIGTVKRF